MGKDDIESVCQIRLIYNMPCEKCKFKDECTKESSEDGKRKQKRRKKDSNK